MDLGDRLIKLANKLLSAGSSEILGTQGGITNATANDVLVPTSKAVKDYVDGRTQPATTSSAGVVQLSNDIDSSSSTVAATSAAIKQLHDLIDDNASAINNNASAINNKYNELNTSKVDKVTGKGLSSNDFTDEYKKLLDNIPIANVTLRWGSQAGGIGGYKIIGISSFILQEEFEVAGGSQGRLPPGTSMAFDCMEDNVSVPLPDGLIDLIKNRYSSLTFSHSSISLSITGTGDNRELVIKNNGSSNIDYWNVKYSK